MEAPEGFEPSLRASEALVLPLDDGAKTQPSGRIKECGQGMNIRKDFEVSPNLEIQTALPLSYQHQIIVGCWAGLEPATRRVEVDNGDSAAHKGVAVLTRDEQGAPFGQLTFVSDKNRTCKRQITERLRLIKRTSDGQGVTFRKRLPSVKRV